eukprot:GEMP01006622.1.p1 GENE.GEMP01006622.1~~GEMP01006622.1.p1  ORF type:complete len:411 (+),score=44.22 GEMP01006622.1:335-1567(+)
MMETTPSSFVKFVVPDESRCSRVGGTVFQYFQCQRSRRTNIKQKLFVFERLVVTSLEAAKIPLYDALVHDISTWVSLVNLEEFWLIAMIDFNLLTNSSCGQIISAEVFCSLCAQLGLHVSSADLCRTYCDDASGVHAFFARFKPFPVRICTSLNGILEDALVNDLVELERECWKPELRLSNDVLRSRLSLEGSPPFLVLPLSEDKVVGVLYVQRVMSVESLEGVTCSTLGSRHNPRGCVVQLLYINIHPCLDLGCGSLLRTFALCMAALTPCINSVVAISRCRNYLNERTAFAGFDDYVRACAIGDKNDPGVGFHLSGGAKITKVIKNFRPEDIENDGCGVLVTYRVRGDDTGKTDFDNSRDSSINSTSLAAAPKASLSRMSKDDFFHMIKYIAVGSFGLDIGSITANMD